MEIDTKSERFRAAFGAYQRTFTAGHADALAAALEAWEAAAHTPVVQSGGPFHGQGGAMGSSVAVVTMYVGSKPAKQDSET